MTPPTDAMESAAAQPKSAGTLYLERLAREAIEQTRLRTPPVEYLPPDPEFIASIAGALEDEEFELAPRPRA